MPACPHHHSEACPQRHRAQPGREAEGLAKRREWTLCLSLGTAIASSFVSSGVFPTRMGRSTFEPGARVSGWAVRGMRSAVLRPWRRCAGAVCASRLKYWCRLLFASALPKRPTDHRWNGAMRSTGGTSDRPRRPQRSRASPTTFTTIRQLGAASSPRPGSRCAEYWMNWLRWMLASVLALGWVVAASATVRIHSDPGGRIDQYLDRYNQIRLSGQHVIVDGTCNSACTLLLGSVPRDKICFTEQASLGFHSAWQFDDSGRPVASPSWTRVLWRNYPRAVRTWINRHGGLTPRMIFLRGGALTALYPRCTAAALVNYQ